MENVVQDKDSERSAQPAPHKKGSATQRSSRTPMTSDRIYNAATDDTGRSQLISPPPEETLHMRRTSVNLRSTPLRAESSKRKRNTPQHAQNAQQDPAPPPEATPNPKPRKQSKHRPVPADSPTRRSMTPSLTHRHNPDADFLPPNSARRATTRRTTPIPAYEPPTDVFTPPRVVIMTPTNVSKSSKRKSSAVRSQAKSSKRSTATPLRITIKKELPNIDLSLPIPPASPTDDPLLLSGPIEPSSSTPVRKPVRKQLRDFGVATTPPAPTPPAVQLPPSSPPTEDDELEFTPPFDWKRLAAQDAGTSTDFSMDIDMDMGGPPVPLFDFILPGSSQVNGGWSDSDDDDGEAPGNGVVEVGEGEYTGRFTTVRVRTKLDPPSSATRERMEEWGRPITPFPRKRIRKLRLRSLEEAEGEEEEEEEGDMREEEEALPGTPSQQKTPRRVDREEPAEAVEEEDRQEEIAVELGGRRAQPAPRGPFDFDASFEEPLRGGESFEESVQEQQLLEESVPEAESSDQPAEQSPENHAPEESPDDHAPEDIGIDIDIDVEPPTEDASLEEEEVFALPLPAVHREAHAQREEQEGDGKDDEVFAVPLPRAQDREAEQHHEEDEEQDPHESFEIEVDHEHDHDRFSQSHADAHASNSFNSTSTSTTNDNSYSFDDNAFNSEHHHDNNNSHIADDSFTSGTSHDNEEDADADEEEEEEREVREMSLVAEDEDEDHEEPLRSDTPSPPHFTSTTATAAPVGPRTSAGRPYTPYTHPARAQVQVQAQVPFPSTLHVETQQLRDEQRQRALEHDDEEELEEEEPEEGAMYPAMPAETQAAAHESDSDPDELDFDFGVVKISSADPRAAARAAAILKQHDYDCYTKLMFKQRRQQRERHSLASAGVVKSTPRRSAHRRMTLGALSIVGDRVYAPGSPVVTLPELLREAEAEVSVSSHAAHPIPGMGTGTGTPLAPRNLFTTPVKANGPAAREDWSAIGERAFTKEEWKLLDACFTDARLAVGAGEGVMASVDAVRPENVVRRFVELLGGKDVVETFGDAWSTTNLLRRVKALRNKQRSGNVAPPTTPYTPSPGGLTNRMPSMEVPDFTPLGRRAPPRPVLPHPVLENAPFANLPPPSEKEMEDERPKRKLPMSLLAPRYSHLLEEAVAVSQLSTELADASVAHVDVVNDAHAGTEAVSDSTPLPRPASASPPPADHSGTIGTRVKGFLFSYLPTLSKTAPAGRAKAKHLLPRQPGLPLPPPDLLAKPRGPISTPARAPAPKAPHPKELVHLQPAPAPASRIPRARKPQRMVELHPVTPPQEEPKPKRVEIPRPRRSSGGSVKDLVKGFEELRKEGGEKELREGGRRGELKRVRSVGEWRKTAGLAGGTAAASSGKPGWRP